MSKYTPGPWMTNGRAIEQDKEKWASVVAYVEDEQNYAWRANAQLISATPDLLEALREGFELFDDQIHGRAPRRDQLKVAQKMRAAIAKAEGK